MHRAIWLAKECWDASVATDHCWKWMWCFHRSDQPISVCIRDSLWSTLKDKTTYVRKITANQPLWRRDTIQFDSNVGHLLLRSTELLSSDVRELAEPAEDWCHNHVESNSDSIRKPRERERWTAENQSLKVGRCSKQADIPVDPSLSSLVVSIGFGSFCIAFKCLQDWKKPLLSVF